MTPPVNPLTPHRFVPTIPDMATVMAEHRWPVYHVSASLGYDDLVKSARRAHEATGLPQVLVDADGQPLDIIGFEGGDLFTDVP